MSGRIVVHPTVVLDKIGTFWERRRPYKHSGILTVVHMRALRPLNLWMNLPLKRVHVKREREVDLPVAAVNGMTDTIVAFVRCCILLCPHILIWQTGVSRADREVSGECVSIHLCWT